MQTKTTAAVIEDLVETLEDGKKGFTQAADELAGNGHTDIAAQMREFADQRSRFSNELRSVAADKGFVIDEEGSAGGALHRGWMSLADALTGDDAHAVLAAAESGEDHAVEEYEDALGKELHADVRQVVERQATEIKATHDRVKALRDRTS